MTTKAESIAAAVSAVLLTAPQTPAGARVYRNREEPFMRDSVPAISIVKRNDQPLLDSSPVGRTLWELTLEVLVVARDATAPDAAGDATQAAVHSKIFADRTLGGLAVDVKAGPVSYDQDDDVKEACLVRREYRILYQTTETSLES